MNYAYDQTPPEYAWDEPEEPDCDDWEPPTDEELDMYCAAPDVVLDELVAWLMETYGEDRSNEDA